MSLKVAPILGRPAEARSAEAFPVGPSPTDLKGRTIRGGVISVTSQVTQFLVNTASTVVLGRLLVPQDYGLVGMVTAVTGFLRVLKDFGLSTATVQKEAITHELISTLFWFNLGLGLLMALVSAALGPALVLLYHEPRLTSITVALASTFVFDAVCGQHQALLRRQMRFKALAIIDISALLFSLAVGIAAALQGMGYWALVAMPISSGLVSLVGAWVAEPWRPGLPRRNSGLASMVRFGGYLTSSSLLHYMFRNADNVLIGWRCGAVPLGFYQKAYSLLLVPTTQVNFPINTVAVSTLSRIRLEPERQRRYFVAGYTIAASITIPIAVAATVFAGDIIPFVLGKQWVPSVLLFRLLAPAAFLGALLSPFGWLFVSTGRADREFRASVVWTVLILASFLVGLRFGPQGVAIGYSIMSALLALPVCLYAIKGTSITLKDIGRALRLPSLAAFIAGASGLFLASWLPGGLPSGVRAVGGCALVWVIYALVLLKLLGQWQLYVGLAKHCLPLTWFERQNRESRLREGL